MNGENSQTTLFFSRATSFAIRAKMITLQMMSLHNVSYNNFLFIAVVIGITCNKNKTMVWRASHSINLFIGNFDYKNMKKA